MTKNTIDHFLLFMLKKDSIKDNFGFILIDKPAGPTSHDVIDCLRKITGIKKIGHAGTLDPAASGLLLCAVGRPATRLISNFVKLDKEYEALIRFGEISDTLDREGKILKKYFGPPLAKKEIAAALAGFLGKQEQVPPMFSAKKIHGKKLCDLARKGLEIERPPVEIEIFQLKILQYKWPELRLRVKCSSGTYIRSLAGDLGEKLGCGAYLAGLKRTAIGEYQLGKAKKLDKITGQNWTEYIRKTAK
jgi:tRNA pseudouridine55 synthase